MSNASDISGGVRGQLPSPPLFHALKFKITDHYNKRLIHTYLGA
jgi:hypothetical protein